MSTNKKQKLDDEQSLCAVWDITFHGTEECPLDPQKFISNLRKLAKKYAFQLEACPTTGKHHFQGRISLWKRKRKGELTSLLNVSPLRGMHVSQTVTENINGDPFYVLKWDTKVLPLEVNEVSGPFTDKDKSLEPDYVPRQYRGLNDRLWPWQQKCKEIAKEWNPRTVNLIFDPTGNNGKSSLSCIFALYDKGIDMPTAADHTKLIESACNILTSRNERVPGPICIDLPRGMTYKEKDKPSPNLAPFLIAIEQIKKGHICDMRNHYKEWWFDSPPMFVFCNHLPDLRFLSKDRWVLWKISPLKTLDPLDPASGI